MGYFSNGTEGRIYQDIYCNNCIHDKEEKICAIWAIHLGCNYEECNNKKSILHQLMPRSIDGLSNEVCKMFIQK